MAQRTFLSQFSPQRTDPEALEQILVQRHELLAESVGKIRESVLTGNKHHLLFIGPRGAGKTHLTTLIHHRLTQQADLGDKMRFAWLNEDETSTSFLKLLIRIYRDLSKRYPSEFPQNDLDSIFGRDADSARELLSNSLVRHVGDRTIVLLIENLDSLFNAMPEVEQRTWRAFVQNHPVIATVATAQSLFGGVSDRDQPFFGFFDTIHLKPLNVEDALTLLEKLADLNGRQDLVAFLRTPRGKARLRAIHHLSGGNPRLYIILSDFLTKESLDDLVRPFQETVDKQLTAYYQERLRWLSPQQQEIIQFLCRQIHPTAVKDIAEGIFAAHNTTTGQMKQLRDKGYVSFSPRGREVLYELAEPLMRLSFQVKETHNRQPLTLIVDFLRVWYDRTELEERLARLAPGTPGREYFEAALKSQIADGPNFRHELLRRGLDGIDLANCDEDALERLHCLAEETDESADWYKYGSASAGRGKEPEAMQAWSRVIARQGVPVDMLAWSLLGRAVLHRRAGRTAAALSDCDSVIGLRDAPFDRVAMAIYYRGLTYNHTGKHEDALKEFSRIIALPNVSEEWVANALYGRGSAYSEAGREEEAIHEFTTLINLPGAPISRVAEGLHFRGLTHGGAKRLEEAVADFSRVIHLPGAPIEVVAQSLMARAWTEVQLERASDALSDFEQVFGPPFTKIIPSLPDIHPLVLLRALVDALFQIAGSKSPWEPRARRLVELLAGCHLAGHLGQVLVYHLRTLADSHLNSTGLDQWVDGWLAAGTGHAELEIPLRLLCGGIAWIKTKDETSFLGLAKEERRIVREALGLPLEGT